MIFRLLCEAYHCLPSQLEELTFDQIMILAMKKSHLEAGRGFGVIDADELRAMGKVPATGPGQPRSLVQRLRAQKKAEQKQPSARDLKRRRRKEHGDAIKAARARGEKI